MFKINIIIKILVFILILLFLSSSVLAVEGLITEVNLDKRAVKIKNKWYFLQEKTMIKRNNIKGSLKTCQPINNKYYQWAHLKFDSNNRLEKIKISYHVREGKIIAINYVTKKVKLKVYKKPNQSLNDTKFIEYKVTQDKMLHKLRVGYHVVLVTTASKILKIKRVG